MKSKNKSIRTCIFLFLGLLIVVSYFFFIKKNNNKSIKMNTTLRDSSEEESSTLDIFKEEVDIISSEESSEQEIVNDEFTENSENTVNDNNTEIDNNTINDNNTEIKNYNKYDNFFMKSIDISLEISNNKNLVRMLLISSYMLYKISKKLLSDIRIRKYQNVYSKDYSLEFLDPETVINLHDLIRRTQKCLFMSCTKTQLFITDIIKTYNGNLNELKINENESFLIIDNQNVINKLIEDHEYLLDDTTKNEICKKNLRNGVGISVIDYSFSLFVDFYIKNITK